MSETSTARQHVAYNPMGAEFQQDPYPSLRRLREHDPIHLTRQGWVLTRYDDCALVLASRQFGMRGIERMLRRQMGPGPACDFVAGRFHSLDPPEHTRLRSLVVKAFSARRVEEMRRGVEEITERLLDRVGARTSFDLVETLAYPLPSSVITQLLGTPTDERPRMNAWTERILTLQGMVHPDRATVADGNAAAAEFMTYMRGYVAARRRDPREGLVSALIAAADEGERLTDEEVAHCAVFLSNAGYSTTRNLIASAAFALLSRPDQWQRLVDDPSLISDAVAEALRYDCSLTSTPRFAREDTLVGRRRIAAGAAVFCLLNAANRDPERFPEPDRFDIDRADKKHLAFGGGVHHCLGARLARLQIEVALGSLVRRHPQLRLAAERIEWRSGLYRGPVRVPVVTAGR